MNRPRNVDQLFILTAALLMLYRPAEAHILRGEQIGFLTGFLHPLSGADHIVAMIAVGIWGAQLGIPAIWLLPLTFPLVMGFGGFLGLIGVPLPGAEVGIAFSGIMLGAVVLMEYRAPLVIAAALVGLFGLFHGYAHGAELPPGQNALLYSLGFIVATGLLHATGIAMGLIHRWHWGRVLLRFVGLSISGAGFLFLWQAVI